MKLERTSESILSNSTNRLYPSDLLPMNGRFVLFVSAVVIALSLVTGWTSFAQEPIPQDNLAKIDAIESRCDVILTDLRQLHTNDSLTRVNLGQTYNRISLRLMARLNSRLALARMDSTTFVAIANEFDNSRTQFSEAYNKYESALSSLVKMDCRKKPIEFYDQLITTRQLRAEVSTATSQLNGLVAEYRVAVEQLKHDLASEG